MKKLLCALFVVLQACGVSALQHATTALGAARATQAGVVQTVEARLVADLDKHCGDIRTSEREECAQKRAELFRDAERALEASAQTIDALSLALLIWAERIAAKEADEDIPPWPVCEALSQLIAAAKVWTEVAGVVFPIEPWTCRGES